MEDVHAKPMSLGAASSCGPPREWWLRASRTGVLRDWSAQRACVTCARSSTRPITAWHLSYVVLGAMIAPRVNWTTLIATLLAFFLAVGVAAHALDELRGRPLGTAMPSWLLSGAAALGLGGAVALGAIGITRVGFGLLAFIVVGAFFVLAYDLELFADWSILISASRCPGARSRCSLRRYAQTSTITWSAAVLALAAALLSAAQRNLSNPVRMIRRRVTSVEGEIRFADGTVRPIDRDFLIVAVRARSSLARDRDDRVVGGLRTRTPRSLATSQSPRRQSTERMNSSITAAALRGCFESHQCPTPGSVTSRAPRVRATSLDIASFPNVSSAAKRISPGRRRRS